MPGHAQCFAHAPHLAAVRDEARQRAGRNSSKIVRLRRLQHPRLVTVFDRLEVAFDDVLTGRISPRQAQAAAAVARALVTVFSASELEVQLRELLREVEDAS